MSMMTTHFHWIEVVQPINSLDRKWRRKRKIEHGDAPRERQIARKRKPVDCRQRVRRAGRDDLHSLSGLLHPCLTRFPGRSSPPCRQHVHYACYASAVPYRSSAPAIRNTEVPTFWSLQLQLVRACLILPTKSRLAA